jgi:hypothetical protein
MIFTNLLPYIITFLKISVHQIKLWRMRKKYKEGKLPAAEAELLKTSRVNRTQNSQFSFERKYALLAAQVMIAFSYGFAVPILFVILAAGTALVTCFDKLLITYWERPRFLHTDKINMLFMQLLQVAILPSLAFAAWIMNQNNCIWQKDFKVNQVSHTYEYSDCSNNVHFVSYFATIGLSALILFFMLIVGTYQSKKAQKARLGEDSLIYNQIGAIQSIILRAEEIVLRQDLGI